MAWELMTQEEVKSVQVGQKIRINGTETEVTQLFNREENDFGFWTSDGVVTVDKADTDGAYPLVCQGAVDEYFNENKFEKEVN